MIPAKIRIAYRGLLFLLLGVSFLAQGGLLNLTGIYISNPIVNRPSDPNIPVAASEYNPAIISTGYVYWHNNDGYAKYSDTLMQVGHDFDFWNEAWRGWTEWNLSGIPTNAIITSIQIRLTVTGKPDAADNYRAQICMSELSVRPSLETNAERLYTSIGTGVLYSGGLCVSVIGNGDFPSSTGFYELGAIAAANATARLGEGWFAVGFSDFNLGGSDNPDDEGIIFSVSAIKIAYQLEAVNTTISETVPAESYTFSPSTTGSDLGNEDGWFDLALIGIISGIFMLGICLGCAYKSRIRESKARIQKKSTQIGSKPQNLSPIVAKQPSVVVMDENIETLLPAPPSQAPERQRVRQKILDGGESPTEIVCEYCGEKIPSNSSICPFCAHKFR
jgi:hypothetical protein